MATINLRNHYPFVHSDEFVEVSDEVAAAMTDADRLERNYIRRVYYNRSHYSLDCGDGIENSALHFALSAEELYARKWTEEQIYAALNALPEKQQRRVYAYYIRGIRQVEIARREGVSVTNVSTSIRLGLKNMRAFLQNRL